MSMFSWPLQLCTPSFDEVGEEEEEDRELRAVPLELCVVCPVREGGHH